MHINWNRPNWVYMGYFCPGLTIHTRALQSLCVVTIFVYLVLAGKFQLVDDLVIPQQINL